MPLTAVVNIKTETYDIYCGRGGHGRPGPFGNPFIIGKDGDRDTVVDRFADWLINSPSARAQWIRDNLHTLRGKRLGCYCAPLRCHCHILAALADSPWGDPPHA